MIVGNLIKQLSMFDEEYQKELTILVYHPITKLRHEFELIWVGNNSNCLEIRALERKEPK